MGSDGNPFDVSLVSRFIFSCFCKEAQAEWK